jgi:glyoxylase-like metal-dependent hydrolase (beta-lactamase superfamily II)
LENFKAVWQPDDVDAVVCTHMHVDHVGWNTMLVDRQWVPTFATPVLVESNGESAVITGDLMHSPCQFGHRAWSNIYDTGWDAAVATRHAFLERFANTSTIVIGTHFGTPTGVLVRRDGSAFRLSPAG